MRMSGPMIPAFRMWLFASLVFSIPFGALQAGNNDPMSPVFAGFESVLSAAPCAADGCGTVFRWPGQKPGSGGPDLNAPLVTDRPDFTEASSTVGMGVAQIEFGYTYTRDEQLGTSITEHSVGEPLLRYGMFADWLEFRLAMFPLQQKVAGAGTSVTDSGLGDLYTGFKIALTPQLDLLPEMALIPQLNLPTGSSVFTSDHVEPGVNWIYSWEINDQISTAGSTQVNRRIDGTTSDDYAEWAQSWTVACSCSDQLGAYTEWFALIPAGSDTESTEHYFNGGFTWLFSDDVQFDIRAGTGLNGPAADYFVGTGLSIRFH